MNKKIILFTALFLSSNSFCEDNYKDLKDKAYALYATKNYNEAKQK